MTPNYQAIMAAQQLILRELGARYHADPDAEQLPEPGPHIGGPEALAEHCADMTLLEQEQARVICMNAKAQLLQQVTVAMGTGNLTTIRVADVFRPAIACGATQISFAHNHPSGDPTPSPQDVGLTKQLYEAGELLGIDLVDHVIIGRHGRWTSLRARGFMTYCDKRDGATGPASGAEDAETPATNR